MTEAVLALLPTLVVVAALGALALLALVARLVSPDREYVDSTLDDILRERDELERR